MKMRMKSFANGLWAKVRSFVNGLRAILNKPAIIRVCMCVVMMFLIIGVTYAQDTSAGTAALTQVTSDIAKYIPIVQKLIYAIAGVVAVVGAISVYIKMNNEEQDVKKSIMLIIGSCIFLVAAATALPGFFGY